MIDVVVVYDRKSASMLEQIEFQDAPAAAFAKRLDRERAHRQHRDVEVVLVSANSLDDLKISHARYFDPQAISAEKLSEELARRIAS
jgi:hypothetical protein